MADRSALDPATLAFGRALAGAVKQAIDTIDDPNRVIAMLLSALAVAIDLMADTLPEPLRAEFREAAWVSAQRSIETHQALVVYHETIPPKGTV